MSYTVASLTAVALALVVDLVLRTGLARSRSWWTAYGIVVFFQLLTNGWLTGRGIVQYAGSAIVGSGRITAFGDGRIAYAPVEDLGFGFALVLSSCAMWVWAGRGDRRTRRAPVRRSSAVGAEGRSRGR